MKLGVHLVGQGNQRDKTSLEEGHSLKKAEKFWNAKFPNYNKLLLNVSNH